MAAVSAVTGTTLRAIPHFAGLSITEREAVARQCRATRFARGSLVFTQCSECESVFFIIVGTARVAYYSSDGHEVAIRLYRAGECFGDLVPLDGERQALEARADSELFVVSIQTERFADLMARYPSIARETLRDVARVTRDLCRRIIEFSTLRVSNRVQSELLRLAEGLDASSNEAVVRSPPTHAELASRISTHREAVTREINHLKKLGLMHCDRAHWVINDVNAMRRMVHQANGA